LSSLEQHSIRFGVGGARLRLDSRTPSKGSSWTRSPSKKRRR
jgi:hypothetical protein